MDATTKTALALISAFLDIMFDEDNQDRTMSLEAVEYMVAFTRTGEEFDLTYVVNHYATTIDGPEEAETLINRIRINAQSLDS